VPGFDALSVRDLVALTVIAARTVAQYHATSAQQIVAEAFEVADAFVQASEGQWANGARANHQERAERRREQQRESGERRTYERRQQKK
jgi:hypothetical protein